MECQKELGHPSFEPFFVPYYEDRVAEVVCSRGHRSVHLIQSQKFEVLLESGANALAGGFTLEGCASFSAALERLYEFALKAIARHRGLTGEALAETFKEMSRQSERQLGAFLILFTLQFGKAYKTPKKVVEFRNSVIHKGFIPTPEEAQEFCANVYSEVLSVTTLLQEEIPNSVAATILDDLVERQSKVDPSLPKATNSGTMFFSLSSTPKRQPFEEAFRAYGEAREKLMASIPSMTALHQLLQAFETHNNSLFKPNVTGEASDPLRR